jgi:hypothetical protein
MAYVTRYGKRRPRPSSSTNGMQRLVTLDGTKATFECVAAGHRMTRDYGKGPRSMRLSPSVLKLLASSWGFDSASTGSRGHLYGWCQRCQNEVDGVARIAYAPFCFDERHGEPCPMPCATCFEECAPAGWRDNAVNRRRAAEWLARQPKISEVRS